MTEEPTPAPLTPLRDWIAKNPSVAVSVASLIVAMTALYLAYTVQARDIEYKEMLIRPALRLDFDTTTFTVEITNIGLGPAVLKEVTYRFDKCYYVSNSFSLKPDVLTLQMQLARHFVRSLYEFGFPFPRATEDQPHVRVEILGAGTLIPVGKTQQLFSLDDHQVKKMRAAQADQAAQLRLNAAFHRTVAALPMDIAFCSISGGYCSGTRGGLCPRLSPRPSPDGLMRGEPSSVSVR